MTMIALRHQKTHALVITDEANEQMFLEAGYIRKGRDTEPVPSENKSKKSRSKKKKVIEDATDADGSM